MDSHHQIRNIAIIAHVDAGKTSLTENFLFLSGAIREQGSVDKGTAQTDSLTIEKERGISVKASLTSFEWKEHTINLIDSPGHADFSAEVERSLMAIDAAVLVISGPDGVQSQTKVLWDAIRSMNIPLILFINKLDRPGTDLDLCVEDIQKELSKDLVFLQQVENVGEPQLSVHQKDLLSESDIEIMANHDEGLLESFLDEQLPSFQEQMILLRDLTASCKVHPVLCGSAKAGTGLLHLMDAIVDFLPPPVNLGDELSAIVYKIEHDKMHGRMAGVRMLGGTLKVREVFSINSSEEKQKVNQIKISRAGKIENTQELSSGQIGLISGLPEVIVGDYIGAGIPLKKSKIVQPLLTTQAVAIKKEDYAALAEALRVISIEDPALNFHWLKEEAELHLQIMGWIQIEILKHILLERFGIQADFLPPSVIYKETPKRIGFGFESYTMPKPCWAVVKFRIEPGEIGSGVTYLSEVSVDKIHQKYQNEVKRTINKALQQGIKGWEVSDCKVTLVDGEDHEIHSRPGDFILAAHMGIMKGLEKTETTLLEPIIAFKISAPEELLGQIVSDITQMRGSFESPVISEAGFSMIGKLPLATSIDYPVKLTSRSGGKARIQTSFLKYAPCEDEHGVIREYKGINPLDRSKFILKWRGAIQ